MFCQIDVGLFYLVGTPLTLLSSKQTQPFAIFKSTRLHAFVTTEQHIFICLIDTTLKIIIMGLPGEQKEHESLKERDMNVVEQESFSLKPHTLSFQAQGSVPGGHGEFFPSPTAEGIPRTHISSRLSNMCKYNSKQAQSNYRHEIFMQPNVTAYSL